MIKKFYILRNFVFSFILSWIKSCNKHQKCKVFIELSSPSSIHHPCHHPLVFPHSLLFINYSHPIGIIQVLNKAGKKVFLPTFRKQKINMFCCVQFFGSKIVQMLKCTHKNIQFNIKQQLLFSLSLYTYLDKTAKSGAEIWLWFRVLCNPILMKIYTIFHFT